MWEVDPETRSKVCINLTIFAKSLCAQAFERNTEAEILYNED